MDSDDEKQLELDTSNGEAVFATIMAHADDGMIGRLTKSMVARKFKAMPCTVDSICDLVAPK